jgi:hypothetical protein
VFAQQQGFIVSGDPPRALLVVRLPLVRRIKCGYTGCQGISDPPVYAGIPAPRLPDMPRMAGEWPST